MSRFASQVTVRRGPVGLVLPRQTVYLFPPLQKFDPICVRLVTHSTDPSKAVACLVGFCKLVCEHDYFDVLVASHRDGGWLDEVEVTDAFLQRELRSLGSIGQDVPRPTMDDFYLLLTVMLCNLPRIRNSNMSGDWFQRRVDDLLPLFPNASAPPKVPPYTAPQADAIARFGEEWPYTRGAICRALLHGSFAGPMAQVQGYVAVGWDFAGMKHARLVVDFFLTERHASVLGSIPELRNKRHRLQQFLEAYQSQGADGPYMKLLQLRGAATTIRRHLGLHVAAAYALALRENEKWKEYQGVPRDHMERAVIEKVTAIMDRTTAEDGK